MYGLDSVILKQTMFYTTIKTTSFVFKFYGTYRSFVVKSFGASFTITPYLPSLSRDSDTFMTNIS